MAAYPGRQPMGDGQYATIVTGRLPAEHVWRVGSDPVRTQILASLNSGAVQQVRLRSL